MVVLNLQYLQDWRSGYCRILATLYDIVLDLNLRSQTERASACALRFGFARLVRPQNSVTSFMKVSELWTFHIRNLLSSEVYYSVSRIVQNQSILDLCYSPAHDCFSEGFMSPHGARRSRDFGPLCMNLWNGIIEWHTSHPPDASYLAFSPQHLLLAVLLCRVQ